MRKARQVMYNCVNGPLHKTRLSLATPVTMPFTIKGESGRYRPAMFEVRGHSIRAEPIILMVVDPCGHNVSRAKITTKYQNEPVGKNIYWEPL